MVFLGQNKSYITETARLQSLCANPINHFRKCFQFEKIWVKFPGFLEVVATAWVCPRREFDAFRWLDWSLRNMARALQSWSQRFVGNIKLQLAIAKEIIRRLEVAQEKRVHSEREHSLRKELKMKCLALASLERTTARQRSRLLWLTEGDANTHFFQLQACHR